MDGHSDVTADQSVFDVSPFLRLFINKEGKWFQNGAEIIHPRIRRHFISLLQKSPEGRYYLRMGREVCDVEVEDAPFVVVSVWEDQGQSLQIELNDGSLEQFHPDRSWIGKENIPYCMVRERAFHARFSRPAYYQLARYIMSEGEDFFFVIAGERFPVIYKDE